MKTDFPRTAVLAVVVMCLPSDGLLAQQPSVITAAGAFDAYARGEHARVADAIARVPDRIGFARELERQAGRWIEAMRPDEVPHRRVIVATVVLEVALAMPLLDAEATKGVDLVKWACNLVRRNPQVSDAERLWHRAAFATLQRIVGPTKLWYWRDPSREVVRAHVSHADGRVPTDRFWKLGAALAVEHDLWRLTPGPTVGFGNARVVKERARSAVRALQKLLADESFGAEANLRIGYLTLHMAGPEAALPFIERAETSTRDVMLLYLAAFVRGRVLEHTGEVERAAAAYEAALGHWPAAQSAATALAAIRFQQGRRQEALALVETAIPAPSREDPWRHYGRADYRLDDLLQQLRRALE